jgi:hypothetical protein
VLADYGGLPAGGAGTGSGATTAAGGDTPGGSSSGDSSSGGSSTRDSPSSGGRHPSSSGGVKGESHEHSDRGIFPGVNIGPQPGSRDWLLLVGIALGALLFFAGRAFYDRQKRRRRNSAYY